MAAPAALFLIVFNYLPMFGIILAFKDLNYSKGILLSDFIGLKNFEFLFKTSATFTITRNTILYNAAFILINLVTPVVVAIIINEIRNKYLAKFYQTVAIMPYFISWVAISFVAFSEA